MAEPLTPEQRQLAAEHANVAYGRASKWTRKARWLRDEFESAAGLALIEAVRNYDPAGGLTLVLKICLQVDSRIRDMLRRTNPLGYRTDPEGQPEILHLEMIPEQFHPPTPEPEETPEVSLRGLLPFERDVIRLLFGEGLDQRTAAERLGTYQRHVSRASIAAIDYLRYAHAS